MKKSLYLIETIKTELIAVDSPALVKPVKLQVMNSDKTEIIHYLLPRTLNANLASALTTAYYANPGYLY